MRKFLLILTSILFSTAALAATKYKNISDSKLETDARAALYKQYPTLTDHYIELLWGYKALELYYEDRGEHISYEM